LKTSEITTNVKDSIIRTIKKRDTLITRVADTARISTLVSQLTEKAILKRSKYATASIRRIGNKIEVECIADELRAVIELQQETISHYKEITQSQKDTITIFQKKIPAMLKPLVWIGGATIAGILALAIAFFIKR